MIKVIIFDLDDTLCDTTGALTNYAFFKVAKTFESFKIIDDANSWYNDSIYFSKRIDNKREIFEALCEKYGFREKRRDEIIEVIEDIYAYDDVLSDLKLFGDARDVLKKLKQDCRLFLVTKGERGRQGKKIIQLGLRELFDRIHIVDADKKSVFSEIVRKNGISNKEILVVGDNLFSEIQVGNQLGLYTVQLCHGRRKNMSPKNKIQVPKYKINKLSELLRIVEEINGL